AQTTNQCGGTQAFSTTPVTGCPTNASGVATFEYCVVVTETATLKNSLFAFLIPAETLTVRSVGTANFPPYVVSGKNIPPSPGFGSAGDLSGIYAYAVPMDGPGNSANYNEVPAPNSDCSNVAGPIQYENLVPPANGVTQCNYLFVAESNSNGTGGAGGSISLQQNQPIAFTFVNDTGANSYIQANYTPIYDHILVTPAGSSSGTFYPNGDTMTNYNYGVCTLADGHAGNCYFSTGGVDPGNKCPIRKNARYYTTYCYAAVAQPVALYSFCPDNNLYGSLSQGFNTPVSDSLNIFSSAYEVLGEPPTYNTNHALTPFLSGYPQPFTVNGQVYDVQAMCPNWPRANTSISAPVASSYYSQGGNSGANAQTLFSYSQGMNVYSTWYPITSDQKLTFQNNAASDVLTGGNSADIFTPTVSGCTANSNAADGGITASSLDPWWGWPIGDNNIDANDCATPQTSAYNDCALLIQQLGTQVPVDATNHAILPDYYNMIEDSSGNVIALDPVYDGRTYTDSLTGASVTNTSPPLYTPTNTTPAYQQIGAAGLWNSGQFVGDYVVTETPAARGGGLLDQDMPLQTSHKCYNPGAATTYAGFTNNGSAVPGYNADGLPIDPIANPQFGAISCNSVQPETYALYWNDMGSYQHDDLGYWNAVEGFTCSVPSQTNYGGGAATLSG
ncbi:MAG: hypothetical protein POH28_06295, partial [Acidocella sp.]|nr:hypothetical protein [Acidocella sp.]